MGRAATLRVDILADAKGVGPGVSQAEGKLSKLGSAGKKVGVAVGAGLAVAGYAAVKFGADAVGAASDVQQSYGALDSVFGKNAAQVKRWAAGAANSVGLAKSEYANLAALVGSQLQGMGVATDKSATKSRDLIKLGADLSATYGGSVADAVSAVSSVLKGETDPIERYGVSIKQADISARLAAQGLDGLTGKAAKQAQAQTVLAMLTKQTTKAHGAFGREAGTLAGQQERLSANWTNMKARIGQGLLPVITKLTGWANNKLLPGLVKLGGWISRNLGPAFTRLSGFIQRQVVPAAIRLHQWFVTKIVPGIQRALVPILAAGQRAFDKIKAAVQRNEPQLRQLAEAVKRVAEFIAQKVLPVAGRFIGFLIGAWANGIGRAIGFISRMVDIFNRVKGAIEGVINAIRNIHWPSPPKWVTDLGGKITSLFGAGDLARMTPALSGGVGSLDRRRGMTPWTSAAWSGTSSSWDTVRGGGAPVAAVGVTIDARTYIDARGAIGLDGDELARVVERAQRRRSVKLYGAGNVGVG